LTKRISIDSQDRITQIQDGNNAILGSYWYDESGFRIRKSSLEPKNNVFSNVEILYPSKFFGLEFIESENVISSVNNVYLNGVRIAALNEAGALAYYLTDQVDSVSTVLDDEGNTLSLMQYLPYGDTFVQRGDLNFSPKFNSQELDRESGFYFFNARFYDPGIARFTSADTLIDGELDTQGWNRFSYVKGNPIGAKDPTGHLVAPIVAGGVVLYALTQGTQGLGEKGESNAKFYERVYDELSSVKNILKPGKNVPHGLPKGSGKSNPIDQSGKANSSVGNGKNSVSNNGSGKANEELTSRAARREAMRKEGIPTSQQPKSQSKNASGREYQYEVPKNGGGKQTKSVQQQTMDRSHPNEKHWEAGKVKVHEKTGEIRYNNYGRPKLDSDKSKVNYE
uniref:RHS repeat-associated core domain-containing protein n=1 Tax=Leptospira interrogans TaxID=173 RepID=UPI000A42832A